MGIADEARAEAEKRYPFAAGYEQGVFARRGFVAGVEWLASRKPEAAPISYAELMLSPDSPLASRKPEAAPSDTTRKKWLVDKLYDSGAYSHRIPEYQADEIHELADEILSRSQPVQVEVTEASVTVLAKHMANAANDWNHNDCDDDDHPLEHSNWEAYTDDARRALVAALGGGDLAEWGVYSEREGTFYHVEPPTRENAEREAKLVGEAHHATTKEDGHAWSHGRMREVEKRRTAALGGGE